MSRKEEIDVLLDSLKDHEGLIRAQEKLVSSIEKDISILKGLQNKDETKFNDIEKQIESKISKLVGKFEGSVKDLDTKYTDVLDKYKKAVTIITTIKNFSRTLMWIFLSILGILSGFKAIKEFFNGGS